MWIIPQSSTTSHGDVTPISSAPPGLHHAFNPQGCQRNVEWFKGARMVWLHVFTCSSIYVYLYVHVCKVYIYYHDEIYIYTSIYMYILLNVVHFQKSDKPPSGWIRKACKFQWHKSSLFLDGWFFHQQISGFQELQTDPTFSSGAGSRPQVPCK